jgi:DNA-binding SARP family transcriptional activator
VEADAVLLDDGSGFWLDVGLLERACAQIQGVPRATLSSSAAHALREAVAAYRGDLLEGWYNDWCLEERERLEVLYLGALAKLLTYSEAHGEYEHGLAYGNRILRCDRAREHAHRGLMRLYYRAGDRTAALRQYDRCVAILREELDVAPTRRTQTLYEQIRADRLGEPPDRPDTQAGMTGAGEHAALALSPARHLTAAIDDLQAQLRSLQEHVASIQRLALGQQQR